MLTIFDCNVCRLVLHAIPSHKVQLRCETNQTGLKYREKAENKNQTGKKKATLVVIQAALSYGVECNGANDLDHSVWANPLGYAGP